MNNAPFPFWTAAASDATFTDPAACAARASEFARRIARRNRIERIAAWAQLPVWGALAAFFWSVGEITVALSLVLVGLGVVAVIRNLARRAGNLERHPEEPCLAHLARQYRRQHNALMSVPAWYIGPLVPGTIAFLAAVSAGMAEVEGWNAALAGLIQPAAVLASLLIAVTLVNWWVAQRIRRDIARLERLAAPASNV